MPRRFLRRAALALAAGTLGATVSAAQEHRHPAPQGAPAGHPAGHAAHAAPAAPVATGAPALLPGLGTWRHPVATRVPRAQRFFDQGLRLAYAFNHDEAARAFAEAARLDPACAMCRWGVAYALGPNINVPVTPEAERRAAAAAREARQLAERRARAEPGPRAARELAYADAMARRVAEPAGADRAARDSAYAAAMADVVRRWPDDADARVLHADALLNLRPWNQWTRDGRPQPGTLDAVAALEHVVRREPAHAGACHFYVHAVEASSDPGRALACAERLPRLMPGAGHVVHMPAHVYLRVGRYADAARANLAAVASDRRYVARHARAGDFYPTFYTPHNTHFLWATYLLSGQRARALGAARRLRREVPVAAARANASLEAFLSAAVLTPARFGDWDAVLAEPAPPADLRYARGTWHYARGLAHAARGDLARGAAELDTLRALAAGTPASVVIMLNPAPAVLELAADVLAGELALRQGRTEAGLAHLREAVRREDALTYDEPPPWYHATRHLLGTALLGLGRAAEAEAAFRDDLRAYPENGWSLAGLERALRAQGRGDEARAAAARLARAWRDADVPAAVPAQRHAAR
jgi:tetratricopeptide (TPR) repeat protein